MRRRGVLAFAAAGALLCCLAGCDVRLHDETPLRVVAQHGLGLYEITARIDRPALVAHDSVFVTALIDGQSLHLAPDPTGLVWRGFYSVRCRPGFHLQYRAIWSVQSLVTRSKLVPATPRRVALLEPAEPQQVRIDSSGEGRGGWPGVVHLQFVTEPMTTITGLRIEPLSPTREDREAAAAIVALSQPPLAVSCGSTLDLPLRSQLQRAAAYLTLETDNPQVPALRMRVAFAP